MKREEAVKIAQYLGYELELNSDAHHRLQFMRFRHKLAPDSTDFAMIIWCNGEEIVSVEDFYSTIEANLLNVGKYLKIKQFQSILS